MNDVNQLIITGRLTRDAETQTTSGGTALCKFGVAVNRSWKKGDDWQEEVSFLDVTAWGKLAEACGRLTKGARVCIVGRVNQERWEKDGDKHSKVAVVADRVERIAGREE